MANSKLLKEAIADAKAVRETAIANAKIALEEAFTPRLQSILSKKLQAEMEGEEEEPMEEELDSSDIGNGDEELRLNHLQTLLMLTPNLVQKLMKNLMKLVKRMRM
jgi:hypothetical protein